MGGIWGEQIVESNMKVLITILMLPKYIPPRLLNRLTLYWYWLCRHNNSSKKLLSLIDDFHKNQISRILCFLL